MKRRATIRAIPFDLASVFFTGGFDNDYIPRGVIPDVYMPNLKV